MLAIPENDRRELFAVHEGLDIIHEDAERILADCEKKMVLIENNAVTVQELMDKLKELHLISKE